MPAQRPAARHRRGPRGASRRSTLARPAGGRAHARRPSCSTPRTTRQGHGATAEALGEAFAFSRLVGVVAVMADKDVRGILGGVRAGRSTRSWSPQNSSPRAMPADDLAALAVDVFGDDRVEVEPRLDDAWRPRSRSPRRARTSSAAPACWSPARSSPSARRAPSLAPAADPADHPSPDDPPPPPGGLSSGAEAVPNVPGGVGPARNGVCGGGNVERSAARRWEWLSVARSRRRRTAGDHRCSCRWRSRRSGTMGSAGSRPCCSCWPSALFIPAGAAPRSGSSWPASCSCPHRTGALVPAMASGVCRRRSWPYRSGSGRRAPAPAARPPRLSDRSRRPPTSRTPTPAKSYRTDVFRDTERTLVLIKPDGVARGLVGEVISRIERKGLRLAALELRTLTAEVAETHYAEHRERPFFACSTSSSPAARSSPRGRGPPGDRGVPPAGRRHDPVKAAPAASAATSPSRRSTTSCTAPTRPSRPSARSSCSSPTSEPEPARSQAPAAAGGPARAPAAGKSRSPLPAARAGGPSR